MYFVLDFTPPDSGTSVGSSGEPNTHGLTLYPWTPNSLTDMISPDSPALHLSHPLPTPPSQHSGTTDGKGENTATNETNTGRTELHQTEIVDSMFQVSPPSTQHGNYMWVKESVTKSRGWGAGGPQQYSGITGSAPHMTTHDQVSHHSEQGTQSCVSRNPLVTSIGRSSAAGAASIDKAFSNSDKMDSIHSGFFGQFGPISFGKHSHWSDQNRVVLTQPNDLSDNLIDDREMSSAVAAFPVDPAKLAGEVGGFPGYLNRPLIPRSAAQQNKPFKGKSRASDTTGYGDTIMDVAMREDPRSNPVLKKSTSTDASGEEESERRLCQICTDVSAGFHCGAYVCEACKVFVILMADFTGKVVKMSLNFFL